MPVIGSAASAEDIQIRINIDSGKHRSELIARRRRVPDRSMPSH
jgi:hypothetical protein